MAKFLWDKAAGKWQPLEETRVRTHAVISDNIEVCSPVDGKMYTSRAKYYRHLEDNGKYIVTKPFDVPSRPKLDPRKTQEIVARKLYEARQ